MNNYVFSARFGWCTENEAWGHILSNEMKKEHCMADHSGSTVCLLH